MLKEALRLEDCLNGRIEISVVGLALDADNL
jgi:hypothetical protein